MGYILHMSDFHFGRNPVAENERLESLARFINKNKIQIQYLVFTGDIVDSFEITINCILHLIRKHPIDFKKTDIQTIRKSTDKIMVQIQDSQELIDEYNLTLKELASTRMDEAISLLKDFIHQIGISFDRFIFCCGNHDRLRYLKKDIEKFQCVASSINEEYLIADYEPFIRFCESFGNGMTYKSNVHSHEGINFIIANSNWRAPENNESNNMCIHCGEIARILNDIAEDPNFKREQNIFIAHKPFDDICETAKFPYTTGQMLTTKEIIDRTTVMFLHGDKHSYLAKDKNCLKEFMCGAPLCADEVCYNLIDFSSIEGAKSSTFLRFSNNEWVLIPILSCMDDVFELSKKYLFTPSCKFLDLDAQIMLYWNNATSLIQSAKDSNRLILASRLFASFGDLMAGVRQKITFEDDNIFEQICNLVHNSATRRVFNVKGAPGTGKSVFLTIEYLYMLWKFYTGASSYIPFYINMDYLLKELAPRIDNNCTIETIIDFFNASFQKFLDSCIQLRNRYNLPICIIVDGLETKNTLGRTKYTLEDRVFGLLDDKLSSNDKYIMGFNDHADLDVGYTSEKVRTFQYVLYLKKIIMVTFRELDQYKEFLPNYMKLRNQTDERKIQEFHKALKKLRKLEIDLNLVQNNYELLSQVAPNEKPWNIMGKYVKGLASRAEALWGTGKDEMLRRAAFLLFMRRMSFKNIRTQRGLENLLYIDFVKIRDNPDVAEYLIARYYADELLDYLEPGASIPENSILNDFLPRNLGVMVRLVNEILNTRASHMKVLAEPHWPEMQAMLYSTVVYLIGHDKNSTGYDLIQKIRTPKTDNSFNEFIVQKSRDLALIVCDENNRQLTNEYISKLMDDETQRGYHREYQLKYYQGIAGAGKSILGGSKTSQLKGVGFDFHDCFLSLVSKLEYCFETKTSYPLMEVDLYTICDLIYSRLQHADTERPLFYSEEYNRKEDSLCIAILKKTVYLLNEYSSQYGQDRGLDSRIQAYFGLMKERFDQVRKQLEELRGKAISVPFVSPAFDYKKIRSLATKPRVDWNINEDGPIGKNKRPQYKPDLGNESGGHTKKKYDPIIETIGQHILECLYIAQMFLPADLPIEGYNKATVMSLILMSEVGKVKIGDDFSMQYKTATSYYAPTERQGMREVLSLGSLDGYADLKDLFDPLTTIGETSDINMTICRELKLIQMEYKYYSLYDVLNFSDIKRNIIEHEYLKLKTPICKEIRSKLVSENPDFNNFFHSRTE